MLRSLLSKVSLALAVIMIFSFMGCVRQDGGSQDIISSQAVSESSSDDSSESSSEETSSEEESSSESSGSLTEGSQSQSGEQSSSSTASSTSNAGSSGPSSSSGSGSSSSTPSSSSPSSSSSNSSSSTSSTSSSKSSSTPSSSSQSSSSTSSSKSSSTPSSSSSQSSSSVSSTPSSSSSAPSQSSSSSAPSSSSGSEDSGYEGWNLVWSDEFTGTRVDNSSWTFERGPNIRNDELQYYTDRTNNAYIENGHLVIKTIKESYLGCDFTSASINTRRKRFFTFGKIEMRAKLPYGPGIWPAFWMCGENGQWPANGEIDIMELWGGPNRDNVISANVHWQQNGSHTQWGGKSFSLSPSQKFADEFHIIGMEWDENAIKFYVDGNVYATFYLDTTIKKNTFTKPFYLWVNTAVNPYKPQWGWGDAYDNTYPQYYIIDYIRVYQKAE